MTRFEEAFFGWTERRSPRPNPGSAGTQRPRGPDRKAAEARAGKTRLPRPEDPRGRRLGEIRRCVGKDDVVLADVVPGEAVFREVCRLRR